MSWPRSLFNEFSNIDNELVPALDNLFDLGSAARRWKNLFVVAFSAIGIRVAESPAGSATMGVATLAAGTKTVATTAVTANSRIFITVQSLGTVTDPKAVAVTARNAGQDFTITSADGTDTSVVAWLIVEPV